MYVELLKKINCLLAVSGQAVQDDIQTKIDLKTLQIKFSEELNFYQKKFNADITKINETLQSSLDELTKKIIALPSNFLSMAANKDLQKMERLAFLEKQADIHTEMDILRNKAEDAKNLLQDKLERKKGYLLEECYADTEDAITEFNKNLIQNAISESLNENAHEASDQPIDSLEANHVDHEAAGEATLVGVACTEPAL